MPLCSGRAFVAWRIEDLLCVLRASVVRFFYEIRASAGNADDGGRGRAPGLGLLFPRLAGRLPPLLRTPRGRAPGPPGAPDGALLRRARAGRSLSRDAQGLGRDARGR